MVNIIKYFIFVFFVFFLSVNLYTQDKKVDGSELKKRKQTKVEKHVETKKIWNAYCPVMEDPVDPDVQTVQYKGKIIGFCCKSCIKKFNKDPEKYLKKISHDGQKLLNKN